MYFAASSLGRVLQAAAPGDGVVTEPMPLGRRVL